MKKNKKKTGERETPSTKATMTPSDVVATPVGGAHPNSQHNRCVEVLPRPLSANTGRQPTSPNA